MTTEQRPAIVSPCVLGHASESLSLGHICFHGEFEYFERTDGEVYRAKIADVIMTDGYRFGRWECSRAQFNRFRDVILPPLPAPVQPGFNPAEAFKSLPEISVEVRRRRVWRGAEEVMNISTCYFCWQYPSAPAGMFILLSTEYSLAPLPASPGPTVQPAAPICYGQVNQGTWCQEWYETASKDAGLRARALRKLGYVCRTQAMGTQTTGVGAVKMTLLDIRPGTNPDTANLPKVRVERIWGT